MRRGAVAPTGRGGVKAKRGAAAANDQQQKRVGDTQSQAPRRVGADAPHQQRSETDARRSPATAGQARPPPDHPTPTGTKSTFSLTPQSGQHQPSGMSTHAVPAANPSCSSPASTS